MSFSSQNSKQLGEVRHHPPRPKRKATARPSRLTDKVEHLAPASLEPPGIDT